jgi:hypothetical protein
MYANLKDFLDRAEQPLNIIEEYVALNAKRKVLLCDHYFIEGYETFEKTVRLLWPEAQHKDVSKLSKFLIVLKNTAH